jgi:transcriptional regulator with XRE-family HTH domain
VVEGQGSLAGQVKRITTLDSQIAKRLKAARLQRGFSQTSAGEAVGVSFQQIQKYERGTNRITAAKLYQLAALYDVPIEWFFADLKDKKKDPRL